MALTPRIDPGEQLSTKIHWSGQWLRAPKPSGELPGTRLWRVAAAKHQPPKPLGQEIGSRSIYLHLKRHELMSAENSIEVLSL